MARHARTTTLDLLESFASVAEWYADRLAAASPRAEVPTCPGWTVWDLTCHLGNTHSWAASVLETGRPAPQLDDRPTSHRPGKVALWYLGKAEDLYAVLRATDPRRPCWNFVEGQGTASFWERRQAHETTVHALDLGLVAGVEPPVPPEVAADGVDELLTVLIHRRHARGHPVLLEAPLTVRADDVDRAWTLRPGARSVPAQDGEPLVVPDADDGDDGLQGPAAELYRLLWRRTSLEDAAERGVSTWGSAGRVRRFWQSWSTP